MPLLYCLCGSAASGCLMQAGIPPSRYSWFFLPSYLGIVAMYGLAFGLSRRHGNSGTLCIWVGVFAFFEGVFAPLQGSIASITGVGRSAALGFCVLLAAWQSIPYALAFGVVQKCRFRPRWYEPLLLAALTVVAVMLWPSIFPGQFFHLVINDQALNAPAYVLGLPGLAWLVNGAAFIPAALLSRQLEQGRPREHGDASTQGETIGFALVFAAVVSVFFGSHVYRSHRLRMETVGAPLPTLVMQNVGLEGGRLLRSVDQLLSANPQVRLLVFPEWDFFETNHESMAETDESTLHVALAEMAKNHHVALIYTDYRPDGDQMEIRATLNDGGAREKFRDKSDFIPFVEYVPRWARLFGNFGMHSGFANRIDLGKDDPMYIGGHRLELRVCYDSIVRGFALGQLLSARSAPDLVVLLSNMDDFNERVVALHQLMDSGWAVENGVSYLRAVQRGGSTLIAPDGSVDQGLLATSWNTGAIFTRIFFRHASSGHWAGIGVSAVLLLISAGTLRMAWERSAQDQARDASRATD